MNSVVVLSHGDCFLHDSGADHPEQPARIGVIADRLAVTGLADHVNYREAPFVSDSLLSSAHDASYLDRLRRDHNRLAAADAAGPLALDPDTFLGPHTLSAAGRAAGAAEMAANLVVGGECRRAFCNIRPPGHHAHRSRAGGFCIYNNAAVGIHAALRSGIQRIALIDFDVHHGDGSEQIFAGDTRVLMLSTFAMDLFPHRGLEALGRNMVNVGLPAGADGAVLRGVVEHRWRPAIEYFHPELIVVSAGFDAHRADAMGNMSWMDEDYRWLTAVITSWAVRYCGGRILSILEGGYHLPALARCAELHIRGLVEND